MVDMVMLSILLQHLDLMLIMVVILISKDHLLPQPQIPGVSMLDMLDLLSRELVLAILVHLLQADKWLMDSLQVMV